MTLSRRRPPFAALSAILCFAAAAETPAGGATPKPPSIDAQLTSANERLSQFEAQQTAWTGERSALTSARDTALARVTDLEGQLATVTTSRDAALTQVTTLQGQLSTANGQITALTAERDAAVAKAANPSAQALGILAAAGSPAVVMRPSGAAHPAAAKTENAADLAKLSPLKRAIAKNAARAAARKA